MMKKFKDMQKGGQKGLGGFKMPFMK